MHHTLKKIGLVVVVVAALFVLYAAITSIERSEISQESLGALPGGGEARIVFGTRTLIAEVADEKEERVMGLSGRESLGEQEGLLFVFESPGLYGIWMKEMNFSIDILWLDENFRVVDIKTRVSPETYPNSFYPKEGALYVLEVASGVSESSGVNIGDEIIIEGL